MKGTARQGNEMETNARTGEQGTARMVKQWNVAQRQKCHAGHGSAWKVKATQSIVAPEMESIAVERRVVRSRALRGTGRRAQQRRSWQGKETHSSAAAEAESRAKHSHAEESGVAKWQKSSAWQRIVMQRNAEQRRELERI